MASVEARGIRTPAFPPMESTVDDSASPVRQKTISGIVGQQSKLPSLCSEPEPTQDGPGGVCREAVASCFTRFFEGAKKVSDSMRTDETEAPEELNDYKRTLAKDLIDLFRRHNLAWRPDSYYVSAPSMFCSIIAEEAIILTSSVLAILASRDSRRITLSIIIREREEAQPCHMCSTPRKESTGVL